MNVLEAVAKAGKEGRLLESSVANLKAWREGGFLPAGALASIDELVGIKAFEELNDRFYKTLAFGTGGMRGRTIGNLSTGWEKGDPSGKDAPAHPAVGSAFLNDFTLLRATIGLYRYSEASLRKASRGYEVPRLVIAHDVRHFSRRFCLLAASAWSRLGGCALIFRGPRSTPQLSFSVRYLRATAGVVITASHNPPHDNGYKVYFSDGGQIVSPHADGIIEEVNRVDMEMVAPFLEVNRARIATLPPSLDEAYLKALEENVIDPPLLHAMRPRMVFTPLHGTGGIMAIPLMERFGVEVLPVPEQTRMDPRFPTVTSPNPENAAALALALAKARAAGADAVLATDPDGDRMGVAVPDEEGEMQPLTGNMIGSALAEFRISKLKEKGWLPPHGSPSAALIKTFVTTPLQSAIAKAHGLKVINTLTGFKYIGEKLRLYEETLRETLFREKGLALRYDATAHRKRAELLQRYSTWYVFGGEESYGYLASDRIRDKDAHAAVIMFCELVASLKKEGRTVLDFLDGLYLKYGYFLEDLLNIVYEGAAGARKIARILESYRQTPPTSLDAFSVVRFTDFGIDRIQDADGKIIPRQDFFFLELDNGYSFALRGSGTEPKIKFYLFGKEDVSEPAALPSVKETAASTLETLRLAIESDARMRAGEK